MTDELSGKATVPIGELEDLRDKWREGVDTYERAYDPKTHVQANTLEKCADELDEIIQRYKHD